MIIEKFLVVYLFGCFFYGFWKDWANEGDFFSRVLSGIVGVFGGILILAFITLFILGINFVIS